MEACKLYNLCVEEYLAGKRSQIHTGGLVLIGVGGLVLTGVGGLVLWKVGVGGLVLYVCGLATELGGVCE